MKKAKLLNKEEVNFKNKNQRYRLYLRTFMKHNVESRLFTLQKEAINLTLQTAASALDPSKANLLNLAESIGDVETCIEIIKHTIPKLKIASENIKYNKLQTLKERTDEAEANETPVHENKASAEEQFSQASEEVEKGIKEFSDSIPEKKSLKGFFKHLRNY